MARGIKHRLDEFIKQLSSQYLPYKHREKKGEPLKDTHLQVRLSPIQLYDVSFPKEYRDAMLTTLFGKESKGNPINKKHNIIVKWIRKLMKVKPIPDEYDTAKQLATNLPDDIEMVAIGMKDDEVIDGQEMI